MGRYGIDYVSVKEAAEVLAAAGESVTVEKIRLALGSGSFTTLGKHLRTWRRTQDPAVGHAEAMPDMINDAAQAVWSNLSRAAEERIAEAQGAAQTAVAAAQDAAQQQLERAQQAHAEAGRAHAQELQHLQQRLDEATDELSATLAAGQASEAKREQAEVKAGRAEAALAQLQLQAADLRQQVASLGATLEAAQGREAMLQQALEQQLQLSQEERAQAAEASLEAQQQGRQQRQHLESQLAREQQQVDRLQGELGVHREVLQQLAALRADGMQEYARQHTRATLLAEQQEACQKQLEVLGQVLRGVAQATQEDHLRHLLEQSQQATRDLYQNLSGAMASWTAERKERS